MSLGMVRVEKEFMMKWFAVSVVVIVVVVEEEEDEDSRLLLSLKVCIGMSTATLELWSVWSSIMATRNSSERLFSADMVIMIRW